MADKKVLLELRSKLNAKKPRFLQRNVKIKKRLSKTWRKPKGLHNKMRLNKKGYAKPIKSGYGSPVEVKHLDKKTGLYPAIISNKKDLELIDNKTQAVLLSSTIGAKKKLDIIKIAEEKNIVLLQDAAKVKANIKKILDNKKKSRVKVIERRKDKDKKQKKAAAEKKEKEKKEKEKKPEADDKQVHDNVQTEKVKEADKANKEILQKRV